jgi:hypothetical protein
MQAAGKSGFPGIGHFPSAFIAHGLVGGLISEIGTGNFGAGFLAGGGSSVAPAPVGKQSWEDTVEGSIESATLGSLGSVLGGGKFQDGAITGTFVYLFNECMQNDKCFTNPHEKAVLDSGNDARYYELSCANGDKYYACGAYHIAVNHTFAGNVATDLLITSIYMKYILRIEDILEDIRLDIARAYANYIGHSPDPAVAPSASAIANLYDAVFSSYGLPSWTFGGTPLGSWTGPLFTKSFPWGGTGWCVNCAL